MFDERGKIHSRERAMQLRDYSGLRWDKITPTDIDAFIDFGGGLFVFVEFKLTGQFLKFGQRLALERLVDRCGMARLPSIGFVAEHDNREGDIRAAQCRVIEYRWHGAWRAPKEFIFLKDAIERIRAEEGGKR